MIGITFTLMGFSFAVLMYLQDINRNRIRLGAESYSANDSESSETEKMSKSGGEVVDTNTYQEILRYKMKHVATGLEEEVELTRKSARLNMWVGVSTTGTAVGILLYTLLLTAVTRSEISINGEILFFVPRVSLAFLVEIFSFFFLRLYRRNLDTVKYLTNEITNVKFKIIALESAILKGSNKSIDDILKELVRTERNFILKKGESTVDIEKMKIDSSEDGKILNKFGDYLKHFGMVKQNHA